jgi:putative two-component system response regulator
MTTSGTLLVAGDTPAEFGELTTLLVAAGYQVQTADNSERVLSIATAGETDLVLLDVCGPGTAGVEICRRLTGRPDGPHVPVIIVGPRMNHDWRLAGLLAGAADIVEKPFHREELLACVRLHLGLRRLHAALEAKTKELRWANDVLRWDSTHRACAE